MNLSQPQIEVLCLFATFFLNVLYLHPDLAFASSSLKSELLKVIIQHGYDHLKTHHEEVTVKVKIRLINFG